MLSKKIDYVDGGVYGKDMQHFTEQINFDEDSLCKRVDLLHQILNTQELNDGKICEDGYFVEYFDTHNRGYYNVHPNTKQNLSDRDFTCRQLEFMANYLLYSKENLQNNDLSEYPIETSNDFSNARSTSYEGMKEKSGNKLEESMKQEKPSQHNSQTLSKITDKDENTLCGIKELQDGIMLLRARVDPENDLYSSKDKQLMKKMMGDMKRTQFDIKNSITRPITFNNIMSGRPQYTFWDNTGYYNEEGVYVSITDNKIELSNYRHVYELIKHYSEIKEMVDDDVDSDWRYLLWELEFLIDTTPLSPSEMDMVVWKIDCLDESVILEQLFEKYNIDISQQRLSKILTSKIPKMIVETFLDDRIEWVYTHRIKGDYKRCTQCEKIKLATTRYFSPMQRGKYGLQARCRLCR